VEYHHAEYRHAEHLAHRVYVHGHPDQVEEQELEQV
jgi:hypothetical protein